MVKKEPFESPLQRERKAFERLLLSLERTWNEDVEKEVIALVGGLQNKDHDVQVKQAKRLLFVLAKHGRREQMVIVARLLSFSARQSLYRQLVKEGKVDEAEKAAQHFDLTVLPDDLEAALWPKKRPETKREDGKTDPASSVRRAIAPNSDHKPLTPFGKALVIRLKARVSRTHRRAVAILARIWNTLIS